MSFTVSAEGLLKAVAAASATVEPKAKDDTAKVRFAITRVDNPAGPGEADMMTVTSTDGINAGQAAEIADGDTEAFMLLPSALAQLKGMVTDAKKTHKNSTVSVLLNYDSVSSMLHYEAVIDGEDGDVGNGGYKGSQPAFADQMDIDSIEAMLHPRETAAPEHGGAVVDANCGIGLTSTYLKILSTVAKAYGDDSESIWVFPVGHSTGARLVGYSTNYRGMISGTDLPEPQYNGFDPYEPICPSYLSGQPSESVEDTTEDEPDGTDGTGVSGVVEQAEPAAPSEPVEPAAEYEPIDGDFDDEYED